MADKKLSKREKRAAKEAAGKKAAWLARWREQSEAQAEQDDDSRSLAEVRRAGSMPNSHASLQRENRRDRSGENREERSSQSASTDTPCGDQESNRSRARERTPRAESLRRSLRQAKNNARDGTSPTPSPSPRRSARLEAMQLCERESSSASSTESASESPMEDDSKWLRPKGPAADVQSKTGKLKLMIKLTDVLKERDRQVQQLQMQADQNKQDSNEQVAQAFAKYFTKSHDDMKRMCERYLEKEMSVNPFIKIAKLIPDKQGKKNPEKCPVEEAGTASIAKTPKKPTGMNGKMQKDEKRTEPLDLSVRPKVRAKKAEVSGPPVIFQQPEPQRSAPKEKQLQKANAKGKEAKEVALRMRKADAKMVKKVYKPPATREKPTGKPAAKPVARVAAMQQEKECPELDDEWPPLHMVRPGKPGEQQHLTGWNTKKDNNVKAVPECTGSRLIKWQIATRQKEDMDWKDLLIAKKAREEQIHKGGIAKNMMLKALKKMEMVEYQAQASGSFTSEESDKAYENVEEAQKALKMSISQENELEQLKKQENLMGAVNLQYEKAAAFIKKWHYELMMEGPSQRPSRTDPSKNEKKAIAMKLAIRKTYEDFKQSWGQPIEAKKPRTKTKPWYLPKPSKNAALGWVEQRSSGRTKVYIPRKGVSLPKSNAPVWINHKALEFGNNTQAEVDAWVRAMEQDPTMAGHKRNNKIAEVKWEKAIEDLIDHHWSLNSGSAEARDIALEVQGPRGFNYGGDVQSITERKRLKKEDLKKSIERLFAAGHTNLIMADHDHRLEVEDPSWRFQDNPQMNEEQRLVELAGRVASSMAEDMNRPLEEQEMRYQQGEQGDRGRAARFCMMCKSTTHTLPNCWAFNEATVQRRERVLAKSGLCKMCLEYNHRSVDCPERRECLISRNCKRLHHHLLHNDERHGVS